MLSGAISDYWQQQRDLYLPSVTELKQSTLLWLYVVDHRFPRVSRLRLSFSDQTFRHFRVSGFRKLLNVQCGWLQAIESHPSRQSKIAAMKTGNIFNHMILATPMLLPITKECRYDCFFLFVLVQCSKSLIVFLCVLCVIRAMMSRIKGMDG